jgi:hypothetical protein
MMREILPGPETPEAGKEPPTDWRRWTGDGSEKFGFGKPSNH